MFSKNRRYILPWILLLAGSTICVNASTEPPTRNFRILSLISQIEGLNYDADGERIEPKARTTSFSRPYPIPETGKVSFYRLLPPLEGEKTPRKVIVADVDFGQEASQYLLFMTEIPGQNNHIKTFLSSDSWSEHPGNTMRVFNLSERHTMVKLDTVGQVKLLTPGQSEIFPYPNRESKQASFKVATREEGEEWELRIAGPQLTRKGTRATLVLIDEQVTENRPLTEDLLIRRLIERIPTTQQSEK